MVLDKVNFPKDLKGLSDEELIILTHEIRDILLNKLSKKGGHIGSNLGVIELTIALHYVFDFLNDKIVFDVSHQSYTHKILTGRKEAFIDEAHFSDVTGFTNYKESPYDLFTMGHTSTSISLAVGLAKARDLIKSKENVVALIGDGSMSGGEAFEGLNNGGALKSNLIIVLNDNEMSMCENSGSLYENLKELRETNGKSPNNFFKTLGFDYRYLKEGNDVLKCIKLLKEVKDINHPIILHISTKKGNGYLPAETYKYRFHSSGPFDLPSGNPAQLSNENNYQSITQKYLKERILKGDNIALLSAAAPFFYGDKEDRVLFKDRLIDGGISEPNVMTMASAMAKRGVTPVVSIYSYFIQRTYDQLNQDISLNNLKVVILIYNGTIGNYNAKTISATHVGVFDIPMISNIPNMIFLSPIGKSEYMEVLKEALDSKFSGPVAIRVPTVPLIDYPFSIKDYTDLNKYRVINKGEDVAIIAAGNFFKLGIDVKEELKDKLNIDATLINPVYLSGIDNELLNNLKNNHKVVITLEDGILDGGFGEKISSFYSSSDMKVLNYGYKKDFYDYRVVEEIFKESHLNKEDIVNDIKELLGI